MKKIIHSFSDVHLCPPTLKKVPPPLLRTCQNFSSKANHVLHLLYISLRKQSIYLLPIRPAVKL